VYILALGQRNIFISVKKQNSVY